MKTMRLLVLGVLAVAAVLVPASAASAGNWTLGGVPCQLIEVPAAAPVGTGACPGVRPGAVVESDNGQCSFNFLFAGSDGRRYIGTAGPLHPRRRPARGRRRRAHLGTGNGTRGPRRRRQPDRRVRLRGTAGPQGLCADQARCRCGGQSADVPLRRAHRRSTRTGPPARWCCTTSDRGWASAPCCRPVARWLPACPIPTTCTPRRGRAGRLGQRDHFERRPRRRRDRHDRGAHRHDRTARARCRHDGSDPAPAAGAAGRGSARHRTRPSGGAGAVGRGTATSTAAGPSCPARAGPPPGPGPRGRSGPARACARPSSPRRGRRAAGARRSRTPGARAGSPPSGGA